jgi:hypothetical protein
VVALRFLLPTTELPFMSSASRLCTLLLAGAATGSILGCAAMDKPAWVATKQANDAEAKFYAEVEHEGRIYVIGKSASLNAFNLTHEIPYSQTFIGRGPGGKTVIIEAEAKEAGLQARLRRTFEAKHDLTLAD